MILTVEEFRNLYSTTESDENISMRLSAIENMIRAYTNNSFRVRQYSQSVDIENSMLTVNGYMLPFKAGDTVQISKSYWNDGLYTVKEVDGVRLIVNETTEGVDAGEVSKVQYPLDVVMGAVNMLKWDLERREKVGIQSETISRHSVTYSDTSYDNTILGYPKKMIAFLYPYKRARFGQG